MEAAYLGQKCPGMSEVCDSLYAAFGGILSPRALSYIVARQGLIVRILRENVASKHEQTQGRGEHPHKAKHGKPPPIQDVSWKEVRRCAREVWCEVHPSGMERAMETLTAKMCCNSDKP